MASRACVISLWTFCLFVCLHMKFELLVHKEKKSPDLLWTTKAPVNHLWINKLVLPRRNHHKGLFGKRHWPQLFLLKSVDLCYYSLWLMKMESFLAWLNLPVSLLFCEIWYTTSQHVSIFKATITILRVNL